MAWQRKLGAGDGLYVEPSSAASVAAVERLRSAGTISARDTVVALLTASGLKDPAVTARTQADPVVVPGDIDAAVEPGAVEDDRGLRQPGEAGAVVQFDAHPHLRLPVERTVDLLGRRGGDRGRGAGRQRHLHVDTVAAGKASGGVEEHRLGVVAGRRLGEAHPRGSRS